MKVLVQLFGLLGMIFMVSMCSQAGLLSARDSEVQKESMRAELRAQGINNPSDAMLEREHEKNLREMDAEADRRAREMKKPPESTYQKSFYDGDNSE